jgi:hypothetical protein
VQGAVDVGVGACDPVDLVLAEGHVEPFLGV